MKKSLTKSNEQSNNLHHIEINKSTCPYLSFSLSMSQLSGSIDNFFFNTYKIELIKKYIIIVGKQKCA